MGFLSDLVSDPAKAFTSDLTGGNSAIATNPLGTAAELGAIALTGGAATGALDLGGLFSGGLPSMGTISSALGIAGGINALTGGGITKALGLSGGGSTGPSTGSGTTTAVANPMAPYQAQLANMYAGYLTGGNQTDITKLPGYSQFQSGVLQPAMDKAQATAAASGQLYSGGEQIALQNIGQQNYSQFMNNYLSQLYTGATGGALGAAQLGTQQQNLGNQAVSQGLGAITTGLSGLVGNDGVNSADMYGNTYGSASNAWIQQQSSQMPSQNISNINPNLGWST